MRLWITTIRSLCSLSRFCPDLSILLSLSSCMLFAFFSFFLYFSLYFIISLPLSVLGIQRSFCGRSYHPISLPLSLYLSNLP